MGRPHSEQAVTYEHSGGRLQHRPFIHLGVPVVREKAGAVVDVQQDRVVRRAVAQYVADVADVHVDPRIAQHVRDVRHEPGPQPFDEERFDLNHVDPLDARVAQQRRRREPQAEPADQYPPGLRVTVQHGLGQPLLGGRLDGVHEEHAVDDQLVHVTATS